jgi:hypothetical protein
VQGVEGTYQGVFQHEIKRPVIKMIIKHSYSPETKESSWNGYYNREKDIFFNLFTIIPHLGKFSADPTPSQDECTKMNAIIKEFTGKDHKRILGIKSEQVKHVLPLSVV